jgi:hypothetical protein
MQRIFGDNSYRGKNVRMNWMPSFKRKCYSPGELLLNVGNVATSASRNFIFNAISSDDF